MIRTGSRPARPSDVLYQAGARLLAFAQNAAVRAEFAALLPKKK